jgi:hypothetical protein
MTGESDQDDKGKSDQDDTRVRLSCHAGKRDPSLRLRMTRARVLRMTRARVLRMTRE